MRPQSPSSFERFGVDLPKTSQKSILLGGHSGVHSPSVPSDQASVDVCASLLGRSLLEMVWGWAGLQL